MTYSLRTALITLLAFGSLGAWADNPAPKINLSLAQTSEDVGFNIAGTLAGTDPNVLSELEWYDMQVTHVVVDVEYPFRDRWRFGAKFDYGYIADGSARDYDYLADNRQGLFSLSKADVHGKQSFEGSVFVGFAFNWAFEIPMWRIGETNRARSFASVIEWVPHIGYTTYKTEVEFVDGVQLVPDLGAFEGLDSSYDSEWRGAFVGFDLSIRLVRDLYWLSTVNYYPDVNYTADAQWNLRADFEQPRSFSHSADATGTHVRSGLEWQFANNKTLSLMYQDTQFETDAGVDEVFTVFGVSLFTRLNEANWKSHGYVFRFQYRF